MQQVDRILIGAFALGVWALVAMQSISVGNAQESPAIERETIDVQMDSQTIHASEIVGLSALIESTIRDRPARHQSIPGLDQHIKSVVRGCRVTGSVRDDRITSAVISC
jgi:hypothetical protein